MSTKIEFFRANQIGGCVTVITTDNTKIVIDFGEELPAPKTRTSSPLISAALTRCSSPIITATMWAG